MSNKNNKNNKKNNSKSPSTSNGTSSSNKKKSVVLPKTDNNIIQFNIESKKISNDNSSQLGVLSTNIESDDEDSINEIPLIPISEFYDSADSDDKMDDDVLDNNEEQILDNDVETEDSSGNSEEEIDAVSANEFLSDDKGNKAEEDGEEEGENKLENIVLFFMNFFKGMPQAVVSKIKRTLLFDVLFVGLCIIISVISGFSWIMLVLGAIFFFYSLVIILSLKYQVQEGAYVSFSGIATENKKIGFGKKFSYHIVRVVNENSGKMLSFKYDEHPDGVGVGTPVTLYLSKTEPIIKSEYGAFVEHYISIMFGYETSEELLENDNISAEDYVSKN